MTQNGRKGSVALKSRTLKLQIFHSCLFNSYSDILWDTIKKYQCSYTVEVVLQSHFVFCFIKMLYNMRLSYTLENQGLMGIFKCLNFKITLQADQEPKMSSETKKKSILIEINFPCCNMQQYTTPQF